MRAVRGEPSRSLAITWGTLSGEAASHRRRRSRSSQLSRPETIPGRGRQLVPPHLFAGSVVLEPARVLLVGPVRVDATHSLVVVKRTHQPRSGPPLPPRWVERATFDECSVEQANELPSQARVSRRGRRA